MKITTWAFVSFFVFTSVFAYENQSESEQIMRRAYTSIDRIEKGKIFLKPEKIVLKKGFAYLEGINGAEFAIPIRFSTLEGPYVECGESTLFNLWKCSNCKNWNHKWDNPDLCWFCGATRK